MKKSKILFSLAAFLLIASGCDVTSIGGVPGDTPVTPALTFSGSFNISGAMGAPADAVNVSSGVNGGTAPYTYSAPGLPQGLSIAGGTGVISGTPSVVSRGSATITVTDSAGATASITITYDIAYPFTTHEQYRGMASIPAMTITGSGSEGVFISDRTVSLSAYRIARYETTYELWYEVKTWAKEQGYKFRIGGDGLEGNDGLSDFDDENMAIGGVAPTEAKLEPVTTVDWFDAVLWCNAYSEMSGKTPVYTVGGTVLRDVSGVAPPDEEDTSSTWPVLDTLDLSKNGYRLPTEAEWEAAARGGVPGSTEWGYTYAGSNAVGDVAWYDDAGNGTHPVGGKTKNSAELYDMSGNVTEWCWDWYDDIIAGEVTNPTGPSGPKDQAPWRVLRSGAYDMSGEGCAVTSRNYVSPNLGNNSYGFRVVCAP